MPLGWVSWHPLKARRWLTQHPRLFFIQGRSLPAICPQVAFLRPKLCAIMIGTADEGRSVASEMAKRRSAGPSRILAGAWAFTRGERAADKAWLEQAQTPIEIGRAHV